MLPCLDWGDQGLALEAGLGWKLEGERLVVPPSMRPSWAKSKGVTSVRLPVGSPPAGGAVGIQCSVVWAAVIGRGLNGLIADDQNWLSVHEM